ncbi:MAG: superoxide dismutase [Chlorobium sp.]|jgi:Fe-Mn family superoxide dismutase|uniref:superoxide dismutase n=1 Tax=Chlorobium sp. TaxID=1095 RepID=UPI001DB8D2D6|nr:superoxide dismutase [Chlorobium sp.]MBN1279544.1 superoxide dismutase [Chlorobiaceae bacterium]MCF8215841.1 superoxide dismutase [Chlorobium sp.]MCF8270739.1 superoxide dismutase [Chlorobium sp.]MCF8287051.1 superoxide dismutase [Chlorobium sp.]MCF8290708.1 superoxide dismutase [Chlorobium sp.]
MSYQQPALPYSENALEPHITAHTIGFHYGKHHAAYVTNYNNLVAGTPFDSQSIEDVIAATANDPAKTGIFNNGAQAWNHSFYWNSLSPNGGGTPSGALATKIDEDFGSFEKFAEELKTAAATQFGSGWAWLVSDNGTLKVVKTGNAQTPLTAGQIPLLCIDVWEHAYYLDYQNRRPDYVAATIAHLLNWEFAEANYQTTK